MIMGELGVSLCTVLKCVLIPSSVILLFLRLGVIFLTFEINDSYVWGLVVLTFGG